ncbi:MAG TPA: AsmA family protein, partial [Xanthobacteraceae bacterium]|nr:AsmA family protein [Xanthobacteraceae bacterium]
MQTTLLGLAIAAILALVAALAGPQFVDWGKYRANFEAEGSRFFGQPVRIRGPIDVRLLPTPTIMVRDVEVGSRAAPAFGAQAVRVELALASLMRGEAHASALSLTGPEVAVALDADGRIVSHLNNLGLDQIGIDRLAVAGGRILLEDTGSRTRTTLDRLNFSGELRSQSGQVKGDGSFTVGEHNLRYQLTTGRRDAATRVRLNVESADRPIVFETDGNLTFEKDSPKFEGTVSIARPAGVVLDSGKALAGEPWRITGKVNADSRSAVFEQVDAQYGPDERRLKLGGTAELRFGSQPRFDSVLSARQIDMDRALAASGAGGKLPLTTLTGLADFLGSVGRPPIPVSIGIGIDALTLGGATVQTLRADVKSADDNWSVDTFEFRAPGSTQVRLSGRLGGPSSAAEFSGPVAIESLDPAGLIAWLENTARRDGNLGALKLRSDVTAGATRLVFDRVSAEIDRKALDGRLAYTFASGTQRAGLDVALNAAEFDVEAAYSMIATALGGSKIERPGEVSLAIDLGKTTLAGVPAISTKANLRFDAGGLRIERLAVADFGGAALSASGQIDIAAEQPHGNISLSLTAPKLDGVVAVLDKFYPGKSDPIVRNAARLSPARVEASLSVDPPPASASAAAAAGKPASAKILLNGQLGTIRLVVTGDGTGTVATLGKSDMRLNVRANADDGALISLLGLDALAPVDRRPSALYVAASGSFGGDMRIDSKLTGEGLDVATVGTLKLSEPALSGAFTASLTSADLRGVRRAGAPTFPVALKSNVRVAGEVFEFKSLTGKAGAADVKGEVSLTLLNHQM